MPGAVLVLVAGLVLGCARQGPPAPVFNGAPPPQAPVADVVEGGGRVVVAHGQTLYAVARSQGVPLRSLIDANHLMPPYHVRAGEVLIVPPVHGHLVQHGETLFGVARRYGVEAATLVQLNHLPPPYMLKTGEMLVLPPPILPPAPVETAVDRSPPPYAPPPQPASPSAALPPVVTPPQPTTPTPLAPLPTVQVPIETAPPVTGAAPPTVGAPMSLTPPPQAQSLAAPPAAPPVPPPAPLPPNASEARVAALVAAHAPPMAPLFYWPVRGRVIAVFGPGPGGTHNDGINIAAPMGTTVSAAENGTVAYAGDDLKGFGNLLLIKHPGNWVSAYAHNDVLLVRRGDRVRRGQAVARVGDTGGVAAPQLHFELRLGVKPIDPLDHLPPLVGGSG